MSEDTQEDKPKKREFDTPPAGENIFTVVNYCDDYNRRIEEKFKVGRLLPEHSHFTGFVQFNAMTPNGPQTIAGQFDIDAPTIQEAFAMFDELATAEASKVQEQIKSEFTKQRILAGGGGAQMSSILKPGG